jgi:hypothetical protein
LKQRTRRIPAIGETFDPNAVRLAEQKFAESMRWEVKRVSVSPVVSQRSVQSPRQAGREIGSGFARVSLADRDLTSSFVRAINHGVAADRQRAAEARELSQDADSLRNMGFDGVDED